MIIISINTIRYKKDAKLKTVDFLKAYLSRFSLGDLVCIKTKFFIKPVNILLNYSRQNVSV